MLKPHIHVGPATVHSVQCAQACMGKQALAPSFTGAHIAKVVTCNRHVRGVGQNMLSVAEAPLPLKTIRPCSWTMETTGTCTVPSPLSLSTSIQQLVALLLLRFRRAQKS